MVAEGARVIRTLAQRVANEKTVVEGSVTKNTIRKWKLIYFQLNH